MVLLPNRRKSIHIGLITTETSSGKELRAIQSWLDNSRTLSYQIIDLEKPLTELPSFSGFDVLWYSQTDTGAIPVRLNNIRINDSIKNFVKEGGHLLLTLEGMKYLTAMGVEPAIPMADTAFAKDHGFGRKLGLQAYKSHPVFNGLKGGAYIFHPKADTAVRQIGFSGKAVPKRGKVIAVDRAYITLRENKKLMTEHRIGKGKIISIGAYTTFHAPNYHMPQLSRFMHNVFGYLKGTLAGDINYWNYSPNAVESFNALTGEVALPNAKAWNEKDWELSFEHKPTNDFWDVAGERMLLMGKENGGIEEIWSHPFMALRDYLVGYRKNDSGKITWLEDSIEKVEVTPNAFIRTYSLGKSHLREIIAADIKEPVAAIHYDYSGDDSIRLVVKHKTRLRLMWPYSSKVNSLIRKTWSDALNAHLFVDNSSELSCIVGATKEPIQKISGQFSAFQVKGEKIRGKPTHDFLVSTMATYPLAARDYLDILIASGNQGLGPVTTTYKKFIKRPETVYEQSGKYYEQLLQDKLVISSPHRDFNAAYKWALIGTDRFFVNTPGIGKALVAGYGTTAKGWDGGHEISGRPGYAWYFGRDGQWSGMAMNGYGDFAKVKEVLKMYVAYQSPRGKIFHEMTTSGISHYDAADATPLFIVLAGHYLRHSGDEEFIEENWNAIEKALEYCFSTDSDGDHLIENTLVGHGWVEGGHLFGGKTTLYLAGCWAQALEEAAYMADAIGEAGEERYRNEAGKVKQIINDTLWNEQKQFFYHSINEDGTFIEDETVMPAIPLFFGQVEEGKQTPVLEELARDNFSSDWGMRIAGKDNEHFNPEGYHTGTVWPLYTGWTALAEYSNERPLQGFTHAMNNMLIYKHWSKGFVEEVLHGLEYKPSGVCAHQCWSETMALQPLIEGMLGFEPTATKSKMKLAPAFPVNWEKAKVSNFRVGSGKVDMKMMKTDTAILYSFTPDEPTKLRMELSPYLPAGSSVDSVTVNDRNVDFQIREGKDFVQIKTSFKLTKETEVAIHGTEGIALIPLVYSPKPGDKSDGLRIISSELKGNKYVVTVEGPVKSTKNLFIHPGNRKIKYVEDAKLMEYMQDKIRMRIRFRSKDRYDGYMEKTFRLILEGS